MLKKIRRICSKEIFPGSNVSIAGYHFPYAVYFIKGCLKAPETASSECCNFLATILIQLPFVLAHNNVFLKIIDTKYYSLAKLRAVELMQ